jgi:hypothetical protein
MSDTSGSGSGANDYGGGGFDFELPTYDFIGDLTETRVAQIVKDMMAWLGITEDIDSWSELMDTRLGTILKTVGLIGGALLTWKLTKGFIDGIATLKALLASPSYSIAIGAVLTITGFTIAFDGMGDAVENGLDGFNFGEIIGGSLLGTGGAAILGSKLAIWLESAFRGKAVSYAIAAIGEKLGVGTVGAVGASLAAAGAGVILGIGAMFVGIYDAIKNGIDWLSGILIPAGGAAAGAGVAVILTALGTTLAPGIGSLIGLAVGLVIDGIILLVQNWEAVSAWFATAIANVGQFFVNLWDGIVSVWNVVATWFDTKVIQPVVGFFVGLWTAVSTAAISAWNAIVSVWNVVATWFDTTIIQPVGNFFKGLWEGISSAASSCWSAIVEYFTPAVEWFSALFGSIWQTISDIFYNIGVIASGCWEIIKAAWGIATEWFNTTIIQPVGDFFKDLWTMVSTAAINAWNEIMSAFSAIGDWINTKIIQPVSEFFVGLWDGIKGGAIAAWEGIKSALAVVGEWFNTTIIQPVSEFFSDLWAGFKDGAIKAWEGVKSVFSKVGAFFSDTFQKAWAGIVKVFSVAGDIFNDIKDGIVSAFKVVVNGLIKGLNKVVSIPFNGINSALTWLKDVEILGISPFSSLRTINVPQIPLLAGGGVVNTGQMFIAREAGPEMVGSIGNRTAVANNDQIVESVSRGVYQAVVAAMGQSGGNQVVEAKVNDKVLFEVVVNRNRQETMRTGYSPLLGGV